MKNKALSVLLAAAMVATLLTGCGSSSSTSTTSNSTAATSAAAAAATDAKAATSDSASAASSTSSTSTSSTGTRTKITALFRGSESGEQYLIFNDLLKKFCDKKGLDYDIELVNSDADYVTKLQLYINSNTLPDIFGCPNGALSSACKDIDALVDVGAELKRNGYYDKMNKAVVDFLTDADDGNLYLFPQGLYCEYFYYRKDLFQKAGITDTPTTWTEFEDDCQKLKDIGEVPVVVGGKDNWQIMRYLSFAPWRVTGPEFIMGYQKGTEKFSENKAAQAGVNVTYDLGTKGYFEPGFLSVDYTSASDLFYGGTGAIFYSGSGQISQAEDMYDKGQLGFFPVPDVEGMDNMSTNVPIHAGFAEGFNKATYDETMQEFFDFMCENFSDACYNDASIFSPFNEDLPQGLPQLYYDTKPMFETATTAWTSWDDKLSSDVLTKIVDEQQKLAQGTIKPEEFESTVDSFVAQ
jgi:raffinose/stachyose/melibiose transport system substrate-binding protein